MTIIPRSIWSSGALPETNTRLTPLATPSRFVVIHHTGAGAFTGSNAQMRNLHRYATRSKILGGKGLVDLQYHFLVDELGTVWQGRANARKDVLAQGAHTPGFNADSVAICVFGDYTPHPLGEAAIDAIGRTIAMLRWFGAVSPDVQVLGHRQAAEIARSWGRTSYSTTCPGGIVGQLPAIRERAGLSPAV